MTLCTTKTNNPYYYSNDFSPIRTSHVLWLVSDNGDSLSWIDNSGSNNNGNVSGANRIQTHASGIFGSHFNFTASGQNYIKMVGPIISNLNAYTISLWMKTNSSAIMDIYAEGNDTQGNPLIVIRINDTGIGSVKFGIRDNAGVLGSITYTSANINDGNWHHIVCTQISKSERHLYIDNILVTSGYITNTSITTTNSYLGVIKRTTFSNYYSGEVGEISINGISFTSADVNTNYTNSIYKYVKSSI